LLVRSPRGPDVATNVDFIFVGVTFLALPTHFHGIECVEPTPADTVAASTALGLPVEAEHVHVLLSQGRRYLVAALQCKVEEHTRDIFSSPFDLPRP
jgi:hypothetical protein